ncbi:MAG: VOC family protein [Planctomycetes bacterium]|nr:VOC family protein [Planctomycetota bacterium]
MQGEITKWLDDYDRGRLSRRQLIALLPGFAGAMAAAPLLAHASARADSTFTGTDINHIALTVTDLDRARAFYERHLGLEVARQGRNSCFLKCAEHDFVALFKGEKPAMNHYCYAIEQYDPGDAVRKLKAVGIEPRRRGDRVYFDDPDGLEVQVAAKTHAV